MTRYNFDITIIGGSFTGMTAALALSNISSKLKIALIEKRDILNHDRQRDGRSYAISAASLQLFEEIKIAHEVGQYAGKILDVKITDYKSPFILNFIGLQTDESKEQLGQIIENYHIHNALRNQILKRKNIEVFAPNFYENIQFDGEEQIISEQKTNLTSVANSVLITLNDKKILNSKLVLACDGRSSKMRQLCGIRTIEKKYRQTAIVFNIKHQREHENVAHEKFLPGGPLAILPLHNLQQSSIVWIVPQEMAQTILDLDEENFAQQLTKKMENCLGKIHVISQKFSYPLSLIEGQKFYHKKILFVGDAAIAVHPIAGQGFNLTISEIRILSRLIENNLFCGLDIASQNLINDYNKKAWFEAKKMLIATDILNSLFDTKSLAIFLIRGLGLGLAEKIPVLKKFFIKNAGGF
jgi:2-octaprenyl-6-methoxyphenol hydroxylase